MNNPKPEQTIKNHINNALPEILIKLAIDNAVMQAKENSEQRKINFSVKCVCQVNSDETVEVVAWSEITQKQVERSEKVGETIDLRQTSMKGI